MTEAELIGQVNKMIGKFCFDNNTRLIQFGLHKSSNATVDDSVISYYTNAERLATDDADSWVNRCLAPLRRIGMVK